MGEVESGTEEVGWTHGYDLIDLVALRAVFFASGPPLAVLVFDAPPIGTGSQIVLCASNFRHPKSCCYFGGFAYSFAASNGRRRSEIGGMSVSLIRFGGSPKPDEREQSLRPPTAAEG